MAKKSSVKPDAGGTAQAAATAPASAPRKTHGNRAISSAGAVKTGAARKPAPRKSVEPGVQEAPLPAMVIDLGREEVARLAYSYWETRGYQGGSPMEDWIRAEKELREQSVALKV